MAEPAFLKTYHHSQPVQDPGPRPNIIEARVSSMRVLCLKANAPFHTFSTYYFLFRFDGLTLKVSTWIYSGGNSFKDLAYLGFCILLMLSDLSILSLNSESQCQSNTFCGFRAKVLSEYAKDH
eukprot:s1508_g27.t1